MNNVPAQRITFSLSPITSATAKSRGSIAAIVSPNKIARLMIKAFNIRNRGYGSVGGHLFPSRRR